MNEFKKSLNKIAEILGLEFNQKKESKNQWGYPYGDNFEIIYLENIYNPTHIKRHPYHIVKSTMAPFLTSIPLGFLVVHYFGVMNIGIKGAIIVFLSGLTLWGISINYDSIVDQQHTFEVKRGLVLGMLLFIASEVMFFFSFFWSFFFISLSPTIAIGCVWPPYGLHVYNHLGLPLLNTVLLLLSGAILTDGYTLLTEQKIAHEKFHNEYARMKAYFFGMEILHKNFEYELQYGKSTEVLGVYEQKLNGISRNFIAQYISAYNKDQVLKEEGILKSKIVMYDIIQRSKWLSYQEQEDRDVSNGISILNKEPWIANYQLTSLFLKIRNKLILNRLKATLVCAGLFLYCQSIEYISAPFSLNDGIYGSLFYLLTGFHGFHVFIGSILITIVTIRFIAGNFGLLHVGTKFEIFKNRSTGFACTLFYWHFVDVVWLFLYIVIYWWSSNV